MSWGQFFKWNLLGISKLLCFDKPFVYLLNSGLWHAIAIYFCAMFLWKTDPAFFSTGYTLDFSTFGTLIYHVVIFVVSIKVIDRYVSMILLFKRQI